MFLLYPVYRASISPGWMSPAIFSRCSAEMTPRGSRSTSTTRAVPQKPSRDSCSMVSPSLKYSAGASTWVPECSEAVIWCAFIPSREYQRRVSKVTWGWSLERGVLGDKGWERSTIRTASSWMAITSILVNGTVGLTWYIIDGRLRYPALRGFYAGVSPADRSGGRRGVRPHHDGVAVPVGPLRPHVGVKGPLGDLAAGGVLLRRSTPDLRRLLPYGADRGVRPVRTGDGDLPPGSRVRYSVDAAAGRPVESVPSRVDRPQRRSRAAFSGRPR